MTEWENQVAEYFLTRSKEDDDTAEQKTREKFNISQDTLDYILHCHLVENF